MLNSIFHPKLLQSIPKIFNSFCTIEPETTTLDPNSNEEIITYAPDKLMVAIPCYLEPATQIEIRRPDQTIVENGWIITLQGYYPRIEVEDQARVNNYQVHNILNVMHDDTKTHTYLHTEIVNSGS